MMMSMALMYGGRASPVTLRPSICKVNSTHYQPIRRTRKQQQKMISNARFTTPPNCLRSTSSSFMDLGLLRWEVDKFTHNISRSSYGGALSTECSVSLSSDDLRWAISAVVLVLMLSKNIPINKSFLVPLLALQVPDEVFNWIRGEYGMSTAFSIFLLGLFFKIPGELELPVLFQLLVIIAPAKVVALRGTQDGMIISIAIAAASVLLYGSTRCEDRGA